MHQMRKAQSTVSGNAGGTLRCGTLLSITNAMNEYKTRSMCRAEHSLYASSAGSSKEQGIQDRSSSCCGAG